MFLTSLIRAALGNIRQAAAREAFGWRGAIALAADHYSARRFRKLTPLAEHKFPETAGIVKSLRGQGYCAIEGFVSREECVQLIARLNAALEQNSALIHTATPYDLRLHGIENVDSSFRFFSEHPLLLEIARHYLEEPARVAFTLGASLTAMPGNPGSGGGWHRDSFTRQFKTMLYLGDVGLDNGPFQLLGASHHLVRAIRDNSILGRPYGDSRMSESEVNSLLEKTGKQRLKTLTAKAGTLLLFDSTTIHRGSPIKQGTRYALTNYFFPEREINDDLYWHFKPVAGFVG